MFLLFSFELAHIYNETGEKKVTSQGLFYVFSPHFSINCPLSTLEKRSFERCQTTFYCLIIDNCVPLISSYSHSLASRNFESFLCLATVTHNGQQIVGGNGVSQSFWTTRPSPQHFAALHHAPLPVLHAVLPQELQVQPLLVGIKVLIRLMCHSNESLSSN